MEVMMVSKSDEDPLFTPATRLQVPLVEQVHLRTQFIQSHRVVQTFAKFISLLGINFQVLDWSFARQLIQG